MARGSRGTAAPPWYATTENAVAAMASGGGAWAHGYGGCDDGWEAEETREGELGFSIGIGCTQHTEVSPHTNFRKAQCRWCICLLSTKMHIQIKIAKYQKLVLNWQFTLLTSRRITTVIVLNNGCCMDDHRPATPEAGRGCGQRCDPNVRAPARVSRHGRPADQRANARMRKRGDDAMRGWAAARRHGHENDCTKPRDLPTVRFDRADPPPSSARPMIPSHPIHGDGAEHPRRAGTAQYPCPAQR
jgi:hypothetical protein